MILERLVIIYGRFHRHRAAQEERITHLYTRHHIVESMAAVYVFAVHTEVYSVLLYIITATNSEADVVLRALSSVMVISHLTKQHQIVVEHVSCLRLQSEAQVVYARVFKVQTGERTTEINFTLLELSICRHGHEQGRNHRNHFFSHNNKNNIINKYEEYPQGVRQTTCDFRQKHCSAESRHYFAKIHNIFEKPKNIIIFVRYLKHHGQTPPCGFHSDVTTLFLLNISIR